jgi:hypothetical protein
MSRSIGSRAVLFTMRRSPLRWGATRGRRRHGVHLLVVRLACFFRFSANHYYRKFYALFTIRFRKKGSGADAISRQ